MGLGQFAGPIWTIILIIDCIFFMFLEWWIPRDELDYVHSSWDDNCLRNVGPAFSLPFTQF
jgi:phosphatidylinositol glycan class A protein